MKRKLNFVVLISIFILSINIQASSDSFTKFPKEADPILIGNKLSNRFLEQPHSQYGSPLRIHEPRTQITYPDVCTWIGALWFAKKTDNKELTKSLVNRFDYLIKSEYCLLPKPNHVDNNVFGALALEVYLQTKKKQYKDLGLKYADSQWKLPIGWNLQRNDTPKSDIYGAIIDADLFLPQQKMWSDRGYSWQTRFWLDDMYMITTLQSQAYRAVKDEKYLNRTARQMVLYLDSLQQSSGLFYHAPDSHFSWGRGNGWMAVGMAELLRILPEKNQYRHPIMKGYLKMMNTLKDTQSPSGIWRQVVDDTTMWEETSGSAMFTYSIIVGVKNGWLDNNIYGPIARQAWIKLSQYIEENGDVRDVCEGTNIGNDSEHYRNRKALTGDLHGQAPMLWCAYELTKN